MREHPNKPIAADLSTVGEGLSGPDRFAAQMDAYRDDIDARRTAQAVQREAKLAFKNMSPSERRQARLEARAAKIDAVQTAHPVGHSHG